MRLWSVEASVRSEGARAGIAIALMLTAPRPFGEDASLAECLHARAIAEACGLTASSAKCISRADSPQRTEHSPLVDAWRCRSAGRSVWCSPAAAGAGSAAAGTQKPWITSSRGADEFDLGAGRHVRPAPDARCRDGAPGRRLSRQSANSTAQRSPSMRSAGCAASAVDRRLRTKGDPHQRGCHARQQDGIAELQPRRLRTPARPRAAGAQHEQDDQCADTIANTAIATGR